MEQKLQNDTLYLGVIKHKGGKGFYKVTGSVSWYAPVGAVMKVARGADPIGVKLYE